ncbi:hypothetical protein [Streptomyces sp. NPDC058751]|uniref:hypothetical protein n=1 Tax=Streptomyces sp. NPDC058751 TaxID=3346623 RepID=UPI0036B9D155
MPADEVTRGTDADGSRVRTGPRHAAPRKPLLTRLQMPAGKAIAIAAMPTAVLMGMGFTPTLAQADDQPTSKSLTAEEYQACVEAVTGEEASDTASPSASASASSSAPATPTPSASSDSGSSEPTDKDTAPSSDSGSDDEAEPTASPSASASAQSKTADKAADKPADDSASTPAPSASESSTNPLDPLGVGDAIKDILTPDETASSTPAPSASASASAGTKTSDGTDAPEDENTAETVKDTTDKVTETDDDTAKAVTDEASKAAEDATEKAEETPAAATGSPSPSASATTDAEDCPAATDEEGGVDNPVALPTEPWYLDASSLLLKGADYQGIVKVKTSDGTVKKVLKYVISDGTDIGDLHQTVKDKQTGKTYHVQAEAGSTSTIRDGKTIMYTESISGNLLGLIPVTFDPENPPPLNIPLIYFTKVKVVQAGQFGGTLHIPGLHQYITG